MNLENNRNSILVILILVIITSVIYVGIKDKNVGDPISLGKPCDARDLKSYNGDGNIQGTKGLQCYMYDNPLSQDGERTGVWIYPNYIRLPIFLPSALFNLISFKSIVQDWKPYNNLVAGYNFKFPSKWNIKNGPEDNHVIVESESSGIGDAPVPLITIIHYPNIRFEDTEDYQKIKNFSDDLIITDISSDSFVYVRHFDLNGREAVLIERMENFDLGSSSYDVSVYVTKTDSYYEIKYIKYNESFLDMPMELLIKTLNFR